MTATVRPADAEPLPGRASALLVVDALGEVLACTHGMERLTGHTPEQLRGRRLQELFADLTSWPVLIERAGSGRPAGSLPPIGGRFKKMQLSLFPLLGDSDRRYLVSVTPESAARLYDEDQAMLRALLSQTRVGIVVHGTDLEVTRSNVTPLQVLGGPPAPNYDLPMPLDAMLIPQDAEAILERMARVLESGEPLEYWEHTARVSTHPDQEWRLATSSFRLSDEGGRVLGVMSLFTDITEEHSARRRMALLDSAAQRLGTSLDVTHNAEELTHVFVPDFADLAAVDLTMTVLRGNEPDTAFREGPLRRVAAQGEWPAGAHAVGSTFEIDPLARAQRDSGSIIREPGVGRLRTWPDKWSAGRHRLLPRGKEGDGLLVPLKARGKMLGAVVLWRNPEQPPFSDQETDFAYEVASRAALSIDNARRYTREQKTVEALQRSLLPQPELDIPAARTAGAYMSAATAAGIGGSWYDVIPLSSLRVAFVMGDVAGHGLGAAATIGRLRTAVQTLADLDLTPEELLARLNDLTYRLTDAEPLPSHDGVHIVSASGATCLYCIYDPNDGQCTIASAGRMPPVVVRADGIAEPVPLRPGPALGISGLPFETAELHLDADSVLVFFSQELIAPSGDEGTADQNLERLRELITAEAVARHSPTEIRQAVLSSLVSDWAPATDVSLLVARVRTLPESDSAAWEFAADPKIVARVRELALSQLDAWDLTDNAFATELIVSELVTNSIRHAEGPVRLRLIRNETLTCEVSDASETQPHLRQAKPTDEGGRGLYLVAQLTHRWGSRYTTAGKTIWTEQLIEEVRPT